MSPLRDLEIIALKSEGSLLTADSQYSPPLARHLPLFILISTCPISLRPRSLGLPVLWGTNPKQLQPAGVWGPDALPTLFDTPVFISWSLCNTTAQLIVCSPVMLPR